MASKPTIEEMPLMLQELSGKVDEITSILITKIENKSLFPNYMGKELALQWLAENGYPMSLSKLYKLTRSGKIPHTKPSGKLMFNKTELSNWITNTSNTNEYVK